MLGSGLSYISVVRAPSTPLFYFCVYFGILTLPTSWWVDCSNPAIAWHISNPANINWQDIYHVLSATKRITKRANSPFVAPLYWLWAHWAWFAFSETCGDCFMKGRDDLSKSVWYVISWKMSGQHETIRQHSRNEVGEFLCKNKMEHIILKGRFPPYKYPSWQGLKWWQNGWDFLFLQRQNKQDIDTLLQLRHHKNPLSRPIILVGGLPINKSFCSCNP